MELSRRAVQCSGTLRPAKPSRAPPGPTRSRATNGASSTSVAEAPLAGFEVESQCPVLSALKPLPSPRTSMLESFLSTFIDANIDADLNLEGRKIATGRFLGLIPVVLVGDMGAMREVVAQEAAGNVVVGWPKATRELLGEQSVSSANGDHHRFLRKLLAPALGPEAVEGYLPDIQNIITQTMDRWVSQCAANRTVLASPDLKTMTLRIITSVAMDYSITDEEMPPISRDFTLWIKTLFTPLPIDKWPFPFHASMQARARLAEFARKRIADVREKLARNDGSLRPNSTLAQLLTATDEQGRTLTETQVIDNLLTLMFAGHDTTASQLTRLMADMAEHPQVLERVRAEQARVVRSHGPVMTPTALRDMPYTGAVLAESMRLRPIIGAALRKTAADVGVQGYLVPKDALVQLGFGYGMRKDSRWPEAAMSLSDPLHPAHYNPDRFLTDEGTRQGAQVPFGMGNRSCAGIALAQAEAKVFLATLARGYRFVADTNTKWKVAPILRPDNGLPVFVERL